MMTRREAIAVLDTILSFYRADAKHLKGDTEQMLQLRQAQLGFEALGVLRKPDCSALPKNSAADSHQTERP